MKKIRLSKVIFFVASSLATQVLISEIWFYFFYKDKPNVFQSANGEHFDASLSHLNSVSSFGNYCDSLFGSKQINPSDSERYAIIVSRVLRERFYHGYSHYTFGQNSLAALFAPLLNEKLSAIVIPDDILKHPSAACSQQAIIGMEVFKRKGFSVRKVGFFADRGYGGHFCFEAFYNNRWHFFDPDLEPKLTIMIGNHFPGIAELVKNDSLIDQLYYKEDKKLIKQLLITYSYGPVNKFPATNARIYQYVTKYLSYTLWLWIVLIYFFVRKRLNYAKKKEQCAELQDSLVPEIRA
jgi:hypothetical protein